MELHASRSQSVAFFLLQRHTDTATDLIRFIITTIMANHMSGSHIARLAHCIHKDGKDAIVPQQHDSENHFNE